MAISSCAPCSLPRPDTVRRNTRSSLLVKEPDSPECGQFGRRDMCVCDFPRHTKTLLRTRKARLCWLSQIPYCMRWTSCTLRSSYSARAFCGCCFSRLPAAFGLLCPARPGRSCKSRRPQKVAKTFSCALCRNTLAGKNAADSRPVRLTKARVTVSRAGTTTTSAQFEGDVTTGSIPSSSIQVIGRCVKMLYMAHQPDRLGRLRYELNCHNLIRLSTTI